MKNQIKNLKISVHIPLYVDTKKKRQMHNFKKVCRSFLKISKKTEIFVHSNKKFKNENKKIKFILHDFKNDHPYKLTWYCRKLMFKQKNSYDVFIYCEDDILFTNKNFNYWLKFKNKCLKNNFNLGFLRIEINKKTKTLYSADQVKKSKFYTLIENKKYIILDNPHYAFWIFDKKEFNEFVKTKYFKFNWKLVSISGVLLIREMATLGWHGTNLNGKDMERYKATVIPLVDNKLDKNSFVRHLSNNYSESPAGLFGTFKVKDILPKKLELFIPISTFGKFIKKLKYISYFYLRINLKKYIKF